MTTSSGQEPGRWTVDWAEIVTENIAQQVGVKIPVMHGALQGQGLKVGDLVGKA